MYTVCKSHLLVVDFLAKNEGSGVSVGVDLDTYNSLYTCVVATRFGVKVIFPFVRIK